MLGLIMLAIVIITAVWVYEDAKKRKLDKGESATAWALGTLLFWIIVFPYYLIKRSNTEKDKTIVLDNINELEKLAKLKEKGVVSKEEFEETKKSLLEKIQK